MEVSEIPITYDRFGRMLYHPDFHFSQGERFTESDLEYICKYYEVDHARNLAFAIGKTEHTIRSKVNTLKQLGKYEYYKNLNKHW
ncbi:DNA-entry nuclease [Lysinibacillus sp. KU-BSD001]|uniref:DNA-entry nuclease n=1 Tax=Lysinibacillus sp. KU-BSD001 TaxID=3141328 RepID=UPI0036E087D6